MLYQIMISGVDFATGIMLARFPGLVRGSVEA